MPHPTEDCDANQRCRVCRDELSAVIRRRGVSGQFNLEYRRHLHKNDCSTRGRGRPVEV